MRSTCCEQPLWLTPDEYEAVRGDARHFALVPGHAELSAERIVAITERHHVVEKLRGTGAEIADASDPRAPRETDSRRSPPVA